MRLSDALTAFLYARELAPASEEWYTQKLTRFVEWCAANGTTELESLTPEALARFLRHVRETAHPRWNPTKKVTGHTLHGYARALKAFVRYAIARRWLPADFLAGWKMPKKEQKVIESLPVEVIEKLFAAAKLNRIPALAARDTAILAVLVDTGVRASELCTLRVERTILTTREATLIVWGKGSKERTVSLGRRSRQALHEYLTRHRPTLVAGLRTDAGYVFTRDDGEPLQPIGLTRLLKRLAERAGVPASIAVNPHRFRHHYAQEYLRFPGNDIYKLSHLLGHTSLAVTAEYLKEYTSRDAAKGPSILDNLGK